MLSLNKLSYHRTLFLWLLGYTAVLAILFLGYQYQREREFKAEELNARLQIVNSYIMSSLADGRNMGNIIKDAYHPFDDLRVSVIDSGGKVIYDNTLDHLPDRLHLDRREIAEALSRGSGYTVRRHSQSTGQTYFYSALKGNEGMIVRTAVPYDVRLDHLLRADYGFLWVMCAIIVMMGVAGFFLTRRLGQNVTRLHDFARSVEQGNRISDNEPFPNDELGKISNHIVRLYARLQKAYTDRDREHRNALFEQREKERIKKQLTNNINHELKTPVASIRGCLETLHNYPDLPAAKRMEFVNRGLSAIERLGRMLSDVALITRMEDGTQSIIKEDTDLYRIIAAVCDDLADQAAHKGISIINDTSSPLWIVGNESLLTSIFYNLVANAIAYSGGSRIIVSGSKDESGRILLTVEDNGSGVAEEHIPHLFERFYRIDKGRSRAAGGTGLGLAIVKNAVIIHNGSITAQNLPDGGLRFQIIFS